MPRTRAKPVHSRLLPAALTAGLAFTQGLAACGTPAPPPPPAPSPVAAPQDHRPGAAPLLGEVINRINELGSATSEVRGDLGLVGELAGTGAVRYADGHTDLTLGGHTQASRQQPRQRVEVTVVDDIGYLKSPLLRPEPAKPWLRIDPAGDDFAARLLGPALDQLRDSADPRTTFTGVEAATKVQAAAPDTVDGRPVTRYEIRLLTEHAARIAPDEQQRTRFQQAAKAGVEELSYQLWVDERRIPVRFSSTREVAQAGEVSLTSTYREWGEPVDIAPPPAEALGVYRDFPAPQAHQLPR